MTIFLIIGITSCDTSKKIPPDALKIYPNAQDIKRRVEATGQEITFHTKDVPSAVLAYYEQLLIQQRWIMIQKFHDLYKFSYNADLSEGYDLSVAIIDVRDGKTYVSIIQRGVNPAIIPIDDE
jgi:hypothetical protein